MTSSMPEHETKCVTSKMYLLFYAYAFDEVLMLEYLQF